MTNTSCANSVPLTKRFASIAVFGQATDLGRSTIYELIAAGILPTIKVGKRRLVDVDGAYAALEKHFGQTNATQPIARCHGGEGA